MELHQKSEYKVTLYRGGMIAAAFMVIMIPVQVTFFVIWPHPTTIVDWFILFNDNWIIGLISFDFLYMLSMIASIFLYIALFFALVEKAKALSLFAVVIGLVGLTLYFPSNTSIEMLSISEQYANATAEHDKVMFEAAGQTLYAIWKGTSYSVYYILNGIALILFFVAMMKNHQFRKSTAVIGLIAGVLMTVPATAGMLGMSMALFSLLPWSIFSILVIQDFNKIIRQIKQEMKRQPTDTK